MTIADIEQAAKWVETQKSDLEIAYRPARILLQDFTGVPAVVDLAAMRDAMVKLGGDPQKINPLNAVDLVIDHSVSIDESGTAAAFGKNVELEFERNKRAIRIPALGLEGAFDNFRVVPPGTGICHQVNLEYPVKDRLGHDRYKTARPDCLSRHAWLARTATPPWSMGWAVLGWGVGGIEAEAAMLGQPISMVASRGHRHSVSTGELKEGMTATDLVLTVTQMLRAHGVVGQVCRILWSTGRRCI